MIILKKIKKSRANFVIFSFMFCQKPNQNLQISEKRVYLTDFIPTRTNKMKKKLIIIPLIVLAIGAVAFFVWGKGHNKTLEQIDFSQDFSIYLEHDNPMIVAYGKTGDYEVFTLDLTPEDDVRCDLIWQLDCVNIITNNGYIVFQNTGEMGYFRGFAGNGAVFSINDGGGWECGTVSYDYLNYYNFGTTDLLYAVYEQYIKSDTLNEEEFEFCKSNEESSWNDVNYPWDTISFKILDGTGGWLSETRLQKIDTQDNYLKSLLSPYFSKI
ncbi:hypothetical protein AGMMS50249_1970 [candidate division SR1 bacterium]|nr:hypothetical protein AGMMS50249_1970 [candidate division SR1 bacterium]